MVDGFSLHCHCERVVFRRIAGRGRGVGWLWAWKGALRLENTSGRVIVRSRPVRDWMLASMISTQRQRLTQDPLKTHELIPDAGKGCTTVIDFNDFASTEANR